MERDVTHKLPADIERESMRIIAAELAQLGIALPPETAAVVKRVIHTTADFDYAQNLRFTDHAVERAAEAFRAGAVVARYWHKFVAHKCTFRIWNFLSSFTASYVRIIRSIISTASSIRPSLRSRIQT